MGLARRVERVEILDEGGGSDAEAARSLEDLRRLNRWLFGTRVTLAPLRRWLRPGEHARVLDLGCGSGQMAQALAAWAAHHGRPLEIVAVDLMPRHLSIARQWNRRAGTPNVRLLAADALCLPLADASVDYVTSSLFVHHFDEPALARLFEECRRVARRGVVMSDLWRHPLPYRLYKGLAEPLLVRSPITRADSTASFHRAYQPAEIARIARGRLPRARVSIELPSLRWRLVSRWG